MSSLETQIRAARHTIITDGYEMSIGEIVSLYREEELVINPAFQRLFRWDEGRKTSFIESIILGIPIPPLFVFQNDDGTWELVDGLQRTATILEFLGELREPDGKNILPPSSLMATKMLPDLNGVTWDSSDKLSLTRAQKLDVRRARLRIEILKRESQNEAKYELFRRLNTGGASLTNQEIRNCTMVMIRPEFHEWLQKLARYEPFVKATSITGEAIQKQTDIELVVRFLAFQRVAYQKGLDVHEYLDNAAISMAMDRALDQTTEQKIFESTFDLMATALGNKSFRKWDGTKFTGPFLHSVYEVISTGVAKNIDRFLSLNGDAASDTIKEQSKALWKDEIFKRYSGGGVRGTTRFAKLLPMAEDFMAP